MNSVYADISYEMDFSFITFNLFVWLFDNESYLDMNNFLTNFKQNCDVPP